MELYENKQVRKELLYKLVNPDLKKLANLYQQYGFEIRIVGGAVRDILMGQKPKDIDLASDATPEESLRILKQEGVKTIETGIEHGTITAHIDGEDYEITTLRIDTETDGRYATVQYTNDWKKDAERRDLTFNAMSLDFDGHLYDYFGGYEDLKAGIAKFVGEPKQRMEEDYLRILRYFRFQGRVSSPEFDKDTLRKIEKMAPGLSKISGERIWAEMSKIFEGKNRNAILNRMASSGVLKEIGLSDPDMNEFYEVIANTKRAPLVLASLLRTPSENQELYRHWKYKKSDMLLIDFIIKNRTKQIDEELAKRLRVEFKIDKFYILNLLEYQGNFDLKQIIKAWRVPDFPVNGNDLMKRGLEGKDIGNGLKKLLSMWVDSGYTLSKDQLLNKL